MPGTTTNLQLRYPVASDAPDGAGAFFNLASDIDQMLRIGGAEYAANFAAIQAIPAARTFKGKQAYAADVDAVYRYDGTTWRPWQYLALAPATIGAVANGASVNSAAAGITEMNIAVGIATFNFALYRSAGMSTGTPYFVLNAGFRPAGITHGGASFETSSSPGVAVAYVDTSGGVFLEAFSGTGPLGIRGTLTFRIGN